MIPDLTQICTYACVGTKNGDLLDKMVKVVQFLAGKANWATPIIFTPFLPEFVPVGIKFIQIPEYRDAPYGTEWQTFLLKSLPRMLLQASEADHFMWVHEDGFPIDFDMWEKTFVTYDYIAAPWEDGVVGGGGMSMKSRRFLTAMVEFLPFYSDCKDGNNEDEFVCRHHKETMVKKGIRYAPFGVATRYCSELLGHSSPSFGFHGRSYSTEKYKRGWELINS